MKKVLNKFKRITSTLQPADIVFTRLFILDVRRSPTVSGPIRIRIRRNGSPLGTRSTGLDYKRARTIGGGTIIPVPLHGDLLKLE